MSQSTAFILDLDDTLYPEQDYVFSGFDAVADWIAPSVDLEKQWIADRLRALFLEGRRSDTFNAWMVENQLPVEEWIRPVLEVYRQHEPRLTLPQDSQDLLANLAGHALALITDGVSFAQHAKIRALGVQSHFACTVVTGDLGEGFQKPHMKPYELALQGLGAAPEKTVCIADNPRKDFLTPNRLGMRTIRIRRESGIYAELEPIDQEHAADVTLASVNEVWSYLVHEELVSSKTRR